MKCGTIIDRMSVPESERQLGELVALTKALEVSTYSIKIMANQKKFDSRYDAMLGNDLKAAALAIYKYAWFANDIKVNNADTVQVRLELQMKAIQACNELLVCINIAHMIYRLKSKRVEYWMTLVLDCRKLLRQWHAESQSESVGYAMT